MPLTILEQARRKSVGSKQTMKAVQRGQARVVFVALNAERHVIAPIIEACKARNVELVEVESMQALGRACGIDVGCASAAVLKD